MPRKKDPFCPVLTYKRAVLQRSSFTQSLIENMSVLYKIEFQACFTHVSFESERFVFEFWWTHIYMKFPWGSWKISM